MRCRGALSLRARTLGLLLVLPTALCAALFPHQAEAAPEHEILVAARDLPLGTVLSAADLDTVRVSSETAPGVGAEDLSENVGRRIAVPLRAGEYLPAHAVVGRDLAAGLAEDRAAVGARVRDPQTLQLLSVGSSVRVLGRTGEGQRVDVPGMLLWVPGAEARSSTADGLVSGSRDTGPGQDLALVSVPSDRAPDLALAAGEVAVAVSGGGRRE